jgi:outer membrane protein OmpA-like peptidoglycan-associated protein
MHTPLTTRASSPALTEHPGNTANDDSREEQPTKLPTLEYTAIIRTDTDEILFDLGSSDINQKTRKVLDNMKEMCTGIRLQDYGGKAKLQNIMDMASKMAKE